MCPPLNLPRAQGHEPNVLRGAKQMLRYTNKILFEWNPTDLRKRGHEPHELLKLLDEFGFRIYPGTGPKERRHPLDPANFVPGYTPNLKYQDADFIAVKRGIRLPWNHPMAT